MTPSNCGPPVVTGLGTALPEHSMTQDEAVELAQQICCRTEAERSLIRVLYRRSGVRQRYTALPHKIAFDYLDQPIAAAAARALDEEETVDADRAIALGNGRVDEPAEAAGLLEEPEALRPNGPTTGQRMEFYRASAPPLALRASAAALAAAQTEPAAITHLVTVSCTGFFAPGIDVALIEGLGLPRTVERIHVGFMGCHGAINGLQAADAIIRARPASRVLLCAVELCSLHYCFEWEPSRAVGNAVFADGAAAMVIEAAPPAATNGAAASEIGQGAAPRWRIAATGSCLIPNSTDDMTWRIGDRGFEMYLSPAVPDVIKKELRPWLEAWLGQQGVTIESVGSWAVHPGGPRILSAVEEALGLPRAATATSREILAAVGNMSSPTVLFIIDRLQAAGAPRPCVALGFGPGLTAEAALFV
ncbi:MAG TPA: type III polyketide synthase [Pirellulales bacterium]|nr:type III polyketide synthase [Pirellulales bacterium]